MYQKHLKYSPKYPKTLPGKKETQKQAFPTSELGITTRI